MTPIIAVLSDIHGNMEALEAVLADMKVFRPEHIVVLGDTVGYGPEPCKALERVAEVADLILLGNHERDALLGKPKRMREGAAVVLNWTRSQLAKSDAWQELIQRSEHPDDVLEDHARALRWGVRFVHAAPNNVFERYVWPGNRKAFISSNARIDTYMLSILEGLDVKHGFCGHTHVPAVLTDYQNHVIFQGTGLWNRPMTFIGPQTLFFVPGGEVRLAGLEGRRMLFNPGSVGQPRDGIPAASYALYDGKTFINRRVPYALDETQYKVMDMDLPAEVRNVLVERLGEGR